MPLLDISSNEALENLRNPVSRWPDGRSSSDRFLGVTKTAIFPSFSLSKSDRFFTMGSCFARNIERNFLELGYDVPLARFRIDNDEFMITAALMNKYTVHSMSNEIRWAVEPAGRRTNRGGREIALENLLLRSDGENWFDPHFHTYPASFEKLKLWRETAEARIRVLSECSVFIFTLGLAESWYDLETELYLNGMPPQAAIRNEPNRFRLHVIDHDEIVKELDYIYSLIEACAPASFRFLVTVSPVPFKATLTGKDAIVANSYSKSVQRAAVESFVMRHRNVDYFPSYEAVSCSDRSVAYEHDKIHVSPGVVAEIMERVVSAYSVEPGEMATLKKVEKKRVLHPSEQVILAASHFKNQEYWQAAVCYSGIVDLFGEHFDFDQLTQYKIALVNSLIESDQKDLAKQRIDGIPLENVSPKVIQKLGLQYKSLGEFEKAAQLIGRSISEGEDSPKIRSLLASCYEAMGDLDASEKHREEGKRLAELV